MTSPAPGSAQAVVVTVAHALAGWGLCGATMGAALALTTLAQALLIHALAAPLIFAGLSWNYFRRRGAWTPLRTAAMFVGVVIAMDFFVVAMLIEKSFEMFTSIAGTWLPFALIFVSTWLTGAAVRRSARRGGT